MNINNIKNRISTDCFDKNGNQIYIEDIVLTASNKIGMISAMSKSDNKIIIGFTDRSFVKANPSTTTIITPIISSLKENKDYLINNANSYNILKRRKYIHYEICIENFVKKHLYQKTFIERLQSNVFNEVIYNLMLGWSYTCYQFNDKFFECKNIKSRTLHVNQNPYIFGKFFIYIDNLETNHRKVFNKYLEQIKNLIINCYNELEGSYA